jgi:hypothetical protein
LRDVQFLGGLTDRAAAGDGREVAQADGGHFPDSPGPQSDADQASCRR